MIQLSVPPDSESMLAIHTIGAVVCLVCAFVLWRTADGLSRSRFVRHLAQAIGVIVAIRVAAAANLLAVMGVVRFRADPSPLLRDLAKALNAFHRAWPVLDSALSLVSTVLVLLAWDKLRRYPAEGVGRAGRKGLTAVSAVGALNILAAVVTILGWKPIEDGWHELLQWLDLAAATIVLALFGWQLRKTLGPLIVRSHVVREVMPGTTMLLYWAWAAEQVLYGAFGGRPWYSVLILTTGIAAIVATIVVCAHTPGDPLSRGGGESGGGTPAGTSVAV